MRNQLLEAKLCFELSKNLPKDKKWFLQWSWYYLLMWAENAKS
jgi:hypothetical protein